MSQPTMKSGTTVVEANTVDTLQLPGSHSALAVRSFGMTDPGKVRRNNEDQFLVAALLKALRVQQSSLDLPKVQHSGDQSHLFVVADGIGGRVGGEQASALAIDSVEGFVLETLEWFAQVKGKEEDKVLADFQSALGQANARVLAEAAGRPELRGMGTTLTLAFSLNDVLYVAHVGDSRCYLQRQRVLYRLTRDHTLIEEMVRMGVLPAADAGKHRLRHVITNAVGGSTPEVKVEVHRLYLESGDVVLLCSDGLTEMVGEEEIARVLQDQADPEAACKELVAQANAAGGRDNITVVLARFEALAG